MPDILYDSYDIADQGFTDVIGAGRMTINGFRYTLVDKHGRNIRKYIHSEILDPGVNFVKEGEPYDLVDDRYLEPYRIMGREAFVEMIRQNPSLTPDKAMAVATRVQIELRISILKR